MVTGVSGRYFGICFRPSPIVKPSERLTIAGMFGLTLRVAALARLRRFNVAYLVIDVADHDLAIYQWLGRVIAALFAVSSDVQSSR